MRRRDALDLGGTPKGRLTKLEEAGDLSIRPIFHQKMERIEAHIFVCFLSYCIHMTFKHQLKMHAPGLTVRQALEKFAAMQLLDVHFPTADGRELTSQANGATKAAPKLSSPHSPLCMISQRYALGDCAS